MAIIAITEEVEEPELLLTLVEASQRCRWSISKTKRLIAAGDLRSVKVGWSRRVRQSDLNAFLAALPAA